MPLGIDWRGWLDRLKAAVAGLFARLGGGAVSYYRPALFFLALALLLVVGFRVLSHRSLDLGETELAEVWNTSIARLGISPVFPPAEDIRVGDVWAVVAGAEDRPLLGRGVRIGHINLRPDIAAEAKGRPVFAATAEGKPGQPARGQSELEDAENGDSRLRLSLAGFPGVTITRNLRGGGQASAFWTALGFGESQSDVEELSIPVAETYGLSAPVAAGRLDEWCGAEATRLYCRDEFIRRVMAYSVGDVVLATREGAYQVKLQLRLISHVFMTREIKQRRGRDVNQVIALGQAADRPAGDATAPSVGYGRSSGDLAQLDQVFSRPVVFGFRAISIAIPPSQPRAGAAP
ncbi:hypothetical protein LJR090_003050 [Bosea sp. LjRoot90]|uniref:hypothetical protein n=1 Tax=Bosea sp. LjRoot90 TaxID=3342342 RepID=UPI003ECEE766